MSPHAIAVIIGSGFAIIACIRLASRFTLSCLPLQVATFIRVLKWPAIGFICAFVLCFALARPILEIVIAPIVWAHVTFLAPMSGMCAGFCLPRDYVYGAQLFLAVNASILAAIAASVYGRNVARALIKRAGA